MAYDASRHHRRSIRKRGHDYGQAGCYFVTFCTYRRARHFGRVQNGIMQLSCGGEIARQCWLEIPKHHPYVILDEFVIMPDHVHGLIWITDKNAASRDVQVGEFRSPSKTVGSIVRGYKVGVVCQMRKAMTMQQPRVWHHNYYDRIVPNQGVLEDVRRYIRRNPANWKKR